MKPRGYIASLFWLAVGLCVFVIAYKRLGFGTFREPGSGFIFILSGSLLMILSLIDLLGTFLKKVKGKYPIWSGLRWQKIILVSIGLSAYIFFYNLVGFVISSFLLMVFLFKAVEPTKWWIAIASSLITVLVVYVIFGLWLKIQFPKGLLGI
jgi:hypothetical protein